MRECDEACGPLTPCTWLGTESESSLAAASGCRLEVIMYLMVKYVAFHGELNWYFSTVSCKFGRRNESERQCAYFL